MATRVSCAPEEMIISLFMQNLPAADLHGAGAAEDAEYAEHQREYGAEQRVRLIVHRPAMSRIPRTPRRPAPSSAALIRKTSHPHVEDETKARERCDQGRAAVAHERQRDPFHRRQAGRHRHVVNDLERKPRIDASHQIRAEAILRQPGRLERSKNDEEIEPQRAEHADEALFLRENRKDEVVVGDRQVLQLPLRAVEVTLPGQAAGPDGDARLDRLVTGALRVLLRIDERLEARTLVILERELPR